MCIRRASANLKTSNRHGIAPLRTVQVRSRFHRHTRRGVTSGPSNPIPHLYRIRVSVLCTLLCYTPSKYQHASSSSLSPRISYTTCDARFLQAATRLSDTAARIRHFAPTSTANLRVKHTRIANTMAKLLEESAKPTRLPTANAWIPAATQLPTLPGNE